jgi:hypothetical protein
LYSTARFAEGSDNRSMRKRAADDQSGIGPLSA